MPLFISLFLLFAPPVARGEGSPPELLNFAAATQVHTSGLYKKLSYKARVEKQLFVKELDRLVPTATEYSVVNRNGTTLITKALLTTFTGDTNPKTGIRENIEVSNDPSVSITLQTRHYLLEWKRVAEPVALLRNRNDWLDQESALGELIDKANREVQIQTLCFGISDPLYKLIAMPTTSRWTAALTSSGEELIVQRHKQQNETQNFLTDLDILLDGTTGAIQKATFSPLGGKDNVVLTIEYQEITLNGVPYKVPIHYLKESGSTTRRQSITIDFSSYADESDMPALDVENLQMPIGTTVLVRKPNAPDGSFIWNGNKLQLEQQGIKK